MCALLSIGLPCSAVPLLAFVHKTRDINVPNHAVSKTVVGDVEGRSCVLIDDMIDTGGTIAGAVKVLKDKGAKEVIIAATHPRIFLVQPSISFPDAVPPKWLH